MADYFSTLAGRTLGKMATVRPLIAPRYARETSSGEGASIEVQSVEREAQAAARREVAEPVNRVSEKLATEEVRQVEIQRPAVDSRSTSATAIEAEPPFRLVREESVTQPALPQADRAQSSARDSHPQSKIAQPSSAIAENMTSPRQEQEWRLLPLVPDQQRDTTGPYQPSGLSPQTGENRTAQRQSKPEAPVVHVSIGRIDVRAVMPKAETDRPQAPQARRSTLEKYLRERNGERR